eukprot:gene28131-34943_t
MPLVNNPATSAALQPLPLPPHAWASLDLAARRADAAAAVFRHSSVADRCRLLELISFHIDAAREAVAASARAELNVELPTISMEHEGVLQQLRAVGAVLRRSHWLGAAIETAPPEQRVQNIALGPVAGPGRSAASTAPARYWA